MVRPLRIAPPLLVGLLLTAASAGAPSAATTSRVLAAQRSAHAAHDTSSLSGGWESDGNQSGGTTTYRFDASSAQLQQTVESSTYNVLTVTAQSPARVITLTVPADRSVGVGNYPSGNGTTISVAGQSQCTGDLRVDQLEPGAGGGGTVAVAGVEYLITCAGTGIVGQIAVHLPVDAGQGYYTYDSSGDLTGFGNDQYLTYLGDLGLTKLNAPVVDKAVTPDGAGYWMVGADGGVFSFGDASFHGSTGGLRLNRPLVAMASTPDGGGYWLAASDGGVFAFGDARFYGSAGGLRLNSPVVGMAATPDGRGYWLVASDGGIFTYGDAAFHGSAGALHLDAPVVGMAATPDGRGYWLVASDGGLFTYGDAAFHGSAGGLRLVAPVTGMAATQDGKGYWMVATDGGIFSFGHAAFAGSLGGHGLEGFVGITRS